MKTFPDDDDGDVLRSLQKKGVDLDQPRDIDFYCWAKDRPTAERIVLLMNEMGFASHVHESEKSDPPDQKFSVYGAKRMVPDYDALIRTQIELSEALLPFGTYCDGWGTLVDPQEP